MKLSKNTNRIVGIILTDANINIVPGPEVTVTARFGLLMGEGDVVGQTVRKQWSPKVQEALVAFVEALEKEELENLFGAEVDEVATEEAAVVSPKDIPTF